MCLPLLRHFPLINLGQIWATGFEEESLYKPEAFDSRLFVVIAHVSAHKELQGFTKAIKLLSKSLI
jgi:hypothetical protein